MGVVFEGQMLAKRPIRDTCLPRWPAVGEQRPNCSGTILEKSQDWETSLTSTGSKVWVPSALVGRDPKASCYFPLVCDILTFEPSFDPIIHAKWSARLFSLFGPNEPSAAQNAIF